MKSRSYYVSLETENVCCISHTPLSTDGLTWNSHCSFLWIHSVTWVKVTSLSPSMGRTWRSNLGGTLKLYLKGHKKKRGKKNKKSERKKVCLKRKTATQCALNLRYMKWYREQSNSVPYPVSRWRRDVDSESSGELQNLNTEHQRHVGHLGYFLPDVFILCGLLEVLGLCYLVHKSQDLPTCAATSVPEARQRQGHKCGVVPWIATSANYWITESFKHAEL